jgi:hypothetical protein
MTDLFQVEFGRVSHGWMPVTISYGDKQLSFLASYTPVDSLTELVEALISALTFSETRIVRWNTEPIMFDFTFSIFQELAKLEVRKYPDHLRPPDVPAIFSIQAERVDLVTPYCRALKRLETQDDINSQWRHPFPTRQMRHLEELLSKQC